VLTITLEISEEAYKLVRTEMALRIMADSSHGVPDTFVRRIITAVDNGEAVCRISTTVERLRERAMAKQNPVADCREPSPTPTSEET